MLVELIDGLTGRPPKWLTRGLIGFVQSGTSGDAIHGLHINLTEYGVVLTEDEHHLWKQLSHNHFE